MKNTLSALFLSGRKTRQQATKLSKVNLVSGLMPKASLWDDLTLTAMAKTRDL